MHSPLVLLEPSQPLLSHRHRLCSCFWLQILSLVGAWSPSLWAWKGLLSYLLQPVQRGFQGQGPFLQRRNRNLESFFFFFFSLWHTLEEDGGWEGEGSGHWVVLWCDTEYWVVNLLWFVQKKRSLCWEEALIIAYKETTERGCISILADRLAEVLADSQYQITNIVNVKISWWFLLPVIGSP